MAYHSDARRTVKCADSPLNTRAYVPVYGNTRPKERTAEDVRQLSAFCSGSLVSLFDTDVPDPR